MKLPKVQVLDIDKSKYAIMKYSEYKKMKERLEDLEDCRLIDEAKATSTENYTIEEAAKLLDVDLDKIRSERVISK